MPANIVTVSESGVGTFAQIVTAGRHVILADEPKEAGGRDLGPSPYDLLKTALGACTAMTLRSFALRQGWQVGSISVTVTHSKLAAAAGQRLTDRFERQIAIAGEINEEQKARLLQIAEVCPISVTLQHTSQITTKLSDSLTAMTSN
jgi:putative redox protein